MDGLDAILANRPAGPTADAKPEEYHPDGTRRRIDGLADRPRFTRPSPKRLLRTLRRQDAARGHIGPLPAAGHESLLILTGDYHGWDIVTAVIEMAGEPVAHLRLATLGFNKTQATDLAARIDAGQIVRLTMLVSNMFSEVNRSEYNLLAGLLGERGQTITTGQNHCKLFLWHFADGRKFYAHGSLNLRRCNAFEQIAIGQDEATHDFLAGYIDKVAPAAETQRRQGAKTRGGETC